jgi:cytosine/adenosine deaminase-related metal-dependent hydrolase
VDGPPLERGTVAIDGERIAAVAPHGGRRADVDLGESAVLPGLVNAHTHLDLGGLRGLAPPSPDFTDWLRQVIAHRRARTPEQVRADIRAGLAECVRHGTTLIGDISGDGASWEVLRDAPLRAVVFRELLGLTKDRAEAALNLAEEWLRSHAPTPTCRPGLSPHAPYSVRGDLISRAALLAARYHAPLAVHLAETPAELELLRDRRGPFVAFLQELGVWDPDGLAASPADVMRAADSPALFIHGNYLDPQADLGSSRAVVYCPRTHAAFGHTPHPFRDLLARGVRVALGTDSLASNPDLDILAEIRFLHRQYPDLPGAELLRMATLAGAEALGWQDETGSLAAGKSADLVVIPLTPEAGADPYEKILRGTEPVREVLFRGRWVSGRLESRL